MGALTVKIFLVFCQGRDKNELTFNRPEFYGGTWTLAFAAPGISPGVKK
jgi:hypothetical protein